jgi:hypothetical protein
MAKAILSHDHLPGRGLLPVLVHFVKPARKFERSRCQFLRSRFKSRHDIAFCLPR